MPRKPPPAKPATKAATPRVAAVSAAADEGLQLAKTDAVKYLHSRRQAMFALARHYHLDGDDLQQEAFEVLLTCLRDFTPEFKRADGTVTKVLFNTFFGSRLESKALEMRNRDPEYQARQAHLQDLSDDQKEQFRKDPPLLVQHLDQENTMQEHLRGEVAAAAGRNRTPLALRIVQDGLLDRKLNELIAAERDDKRRAALLQVKVGGIASFEEIAYHFGVTDSRASQILNDLMDAFYVQRLLDGDLKSVAYDFRKLKLNEKRALRLLEEALTHAGPARAEAVVAAFAADYPGLPSIFARLMSQHLITGAPAPQQPRPAVAAPAGAPIPFRHGSELMTAQERQQYPDVGVEWRHIADLHPLPLGFRPPETETGAEPAHIARLLTSEPEHWPLLVTDKGVVIDGARRLAAARARGLPRLLCNVIAVPDEPSAAVLRVALNLRAVRADKPDLYWAISALLGLGLSQQKISQVLGTSRPNVIVYAKVRDKASPALRQLFEDGLIQITNASTAVDLPPGAQAELVAFIRAHGADWGRGPRFNELYEAASGGTIPQLAARQPGSASVGGGSASLVVHQAPPAAVGSPQAEAAAHAQPPHAVVAALRQRQQTLETALRDAEAWGRQREGALSQQTQQIIDLKTQIESLTRELQATQLLQHGDSATLDTYLKEIKAFYAITERLAGAAYHLEKAGRSIRSLSLNHRQMVEIEQLLEGVTTHVNGVRVELVNRRRTPTPPNAS